jgi:E3 ubiquitin-protein ligase SIAH1
MYGCKVGYIKGFGGPKQFAIENLLQSIEMSCSNRKYGCREKIRNHEEKGIYKPYYCPLSGCGFVASSKVLSDHLSHKHGDFLIKFCYGKSFVVSLKSNDETVVLQEENDGKQFILNNSTTHLGNAINICSFGPNAYWSEYSYDILATSQKCKVKLHSIVNSVQRVTLENLSSELIVILFGSSKYLELEICITCVTLTVPPISFYLHCLFSY